MGGFEQHTCMCLWWWQSWGDVGKVSSTLWLDAMGTRREQFQLILPPVELKCVD